MQTKKRMKMPNYERKWKGSMTLEAAIVLPLFLILFMNLYSAMEQYRIHSCIQYSLWHQGRLAMQYGYLENRVNLTDRETDWSKVFAIGTNMTSWISLRQNTINHLDNYKMWRKLVSFQENGLVMRTSCQGDIVDYQCTYLLKPLFSGFTRSVHSVSARFYGHAFTGYSLQPERHENEEEGTTEEEYVFVTRTGNSYHENRNCSYLNPSVHIVENEKVDEKRNESGAKYYPCMLCAQGSPGALLYVTDYGTSYHCSTECTALKRTVYEIKRTEIGGRRPCSKCSGGSY